MIDDCRLIIDDVMRHLHISKIINHQSAIINQIYAATRINTTFV